MLGRKRLVRLHLGDGPSLEGVLVGRPWRRGGYYTLVSVKQWLDETESLSLEGAAFIGRERVLFVQILHGCEGKP